MEQVQPTGGWRNLSKRNAFLIHLSLSILIFMTIVMLMVTLWFPGELFFLGGGWQGLKLVAVIDIILGPALTLLLWKPNKKDLLMDMSLIASIQIAALAYGIFVTHDQRIVAVVFAENNFNTLNHADNMESDADLRERELEPKHIASLDDRKPAILITPKDPYSMRQFVEDMFNDFPQMHERSDHFIPAKGNFEILRKYIVSQETLDKEDTEGLVAKALVKYEGNENIHVFRFKARYGQGFLLYDSSKDDIVDYIKTGEIPGMG